MRENEPENFFRPSKGRKTNIIVNYPLYNPRSIGGSIDSCLLTSKELEKLQNTDLGRIENKCKKELEDILILDILYTHRESQGKWRERKFGVAISMRDIHKKLEQRGFKLSWYKLRKKMNSLVERNFIGKYPGINRNPKGMTFRKKTLKKKHGGLIDIYFLKNEGVRHVHEIKKDFYFLFKSKDEDSF